MESPHTSPASKPASSRRFRGVALLLGLAVAGWFMFGSREPDAESGPDVTTSHDTPQGDATRATPPQPARPQGSTAQHVAPPDAHAGHAHDAHPHPITPEHVRYQNANQMIGAMNDATDVKDPKRLRQLVEVWKEKQRDDPEKYADAYTVIADCLEFPGEESRAKAQQFYDENRASTLRRHIRRHCGLKLGGR